MATLYDELGVGPSASADDLRQAYRRRARVLHPDVHPGPGGEEAMRRLNQAWAVLGDPEARRRYDASLHPQPSVPRQSRFDSGAYRFDPHLDTGGGDPEADLVRTHHSPWRRLPWIAVLAVLAIIFVFTAYSGGPGPEVDQPARESAVGRCVSRQPGYDAIVPCSQPNNGRIVSEIGSGAACPANAVPARLLGRSGAVCLQGDGVRSGR